MSNDDANGSNSVEDQVRDSLRNGLIPRNHPATRSVLRAFLESGEVSEDHARFILRSYEYAENELMNRITEDLSSKISSFQGTLTKWREYVLDLLNTSLMDNALVDPLHTCRLSMKELEELDIFEQKRIEKTIAIMEEWTNSEVVVKWFRNEY